MIVRLGQLLERSWISDGHEAIAAADSVRQGVYLNNIVMFGYPLPNGQVSAALRQRLRGTLVNVVPAQCWNQWRGNFLLRGGENLLVSWAPAHADWPRLPTHGPEVAVLGALLGGRGEVQHKRALSLFGQRMQGDSSGVSGLLGTICANLQFFDPAAVFDTP